MTVALYDLLVTIDRYAVRGDVSVPIEAITYHTGRVTAGSLFCAIKGTVWDGHDLLETAAKNGAIAALVSEWQDEVAGITQVKVDDTREAMAQCAAEFYGDPSKDLLLIGVTGTNGKTTTTYFLESILRAAGRRPGVIGTIETRIDGEHIQAERTTPESVDLQALLAKMRDSGVDTVAMEVSSHAIEQSRILGCRFDCLVFSNLSQDHLDYHVTMDRYFAAKAKLFTDERLHKPGLVACINVDDEWGSRLRGISRGHVFTYGLHEAGAVTADIYAVTAAGSSFSIRASGEQMVGGAPATGEESLHDLRIGSPHDGGSILLKRENALAVPIESDIALPGRVNVYNALASASAAIGLGIPVPAIRQGLGSLKGVPGRMERIDGGQPFAVVVDYAHTPQGLEAVLTGCRELTGAKIICVFGCGGDRDSSKRPQMGAVVSRLADEAIVTSDNPRSEDPLFIIEQIKEGMNGCPYRVIADRREAIRQAFKIAGPGDIVLIAGKGHETGQTVAGKIHPFDDRIVAQEELAGTEWS